MNSCDFSEEETTKALHALYVVPAPEIAASHQDAAASGFTSTSGMHLNQDIALNNQTVPINGRKKVKGVSNRANHSAMSQSSNSAKKNQYALETSSSNKGGFINSSKLTDFNKEKQKQKQNDKHNVACYSDGGILSTYFLYLRILPSHLTSKQSLMSFAVSLFTCILPLKTCLIELSVIIRCR